MRQTLIQTWSDPFVYSNINLLPVIDSEMFARENDAEYFMNHSGQKYISPMLSQLLEMSGTTVLSEQHKQLVHYIIRSKFINKWRVLYEYIHKTDDYNPLNNYNIKQVETPDITYNTTDTFKYKNTRTNSDTTDNDVFGFNSSTAVNADKITRNVTVTDERLPDDNIDTREKTETGTRTTTREGINGNFTEQQLLTQEIELRKNIFLNIVYNDLDSVLTLSTY